MKMEMWFTEKQTESIGITLKTKEILHHEVTDYQELAVINTDQYGKMLVLDGTVQTTEVDEFVYHEMIAHVASYTHPNPKKVLVVGGGDGGAIREFLKHDSVETAVLVEIDQRVTEVCKVHFPNISCGLKDKRATVLFEDGIKYIKEHKNEFDIITVDSTDPVGPAIGLFAKDFYQAIYESLKEDGLFVAQTESPFYHKDLITNVFRDVRSVFPITKLFTAFIPTYPSGMWTFTMGSKKYDPLVVNILNRKSVDTIYYNKDIHKSSFALPNFVKKLVGEV